MASRYRKLGVTTLGACAGGAIAAWALNPFERSPYKVSFPCQTYSIRIQRLIFICFFVFFSFCLPAGECSGNRNATRQTTATIAQWTSEDFAKRRRVRCAHHWRWSNRRRLCTRLYHKRYVESVLRFVNVIVLIVFFFLHRSKDSFDRRRRFCQRHIIPIDKTNPWWRAILAEGHTWGNQYTDLIITIGN